MQLIPVDRVLDMAEAGDIPSSEQVVEHDWEGSGPDPVDVLYAKLFGYGVAS